MDTGFVAPINKNKQAINMMHHRKKIKKTPIKMPSTHSIFFANNIPLLFSLRSKKGTHTNTGHFTHLFG